MLAAWENDGQVFFANLRDGAAPIPAPGTADRRKHPVAVGSHRGETLLVWTEGTAWNQRGSLAWHVIDAEGQPTDVHGSRPDVPVWDLPTAYARPDGDFVILY